MCDNNKSLLSIVELGGYDNYSDLYVSKGFSVTTIHNMRKALKIIKQDPPDVIVAEFNYQSDFRDRSSSLESLMAALDWSPHTKVIVLYDKEWQEKLDQLLSVYSVYICFPFPINNHEFSKTLDSLIN